MPIVQFNPKDLLRGKPITPAWYRVKIDSVGEAPSADKQSQNYPVEGTVLYNADNGDKAFEGYPIDWNFNSKAIGFATGYLEAFGISVAADKRYDLGASVGQELDVFIENGEWQGRIVNRVNHKYRKAQELPA